MNYKEFSEITGVLFQAVVLESQDDWTFEDWYDCAHEVVNSCAEVVYTANAWDLVSSIRMKSYLLFSDAEDALNDMGIEFVDLDGHMKKLAYQILFNQVMGMVEAMKFYPKEVVA